MRTELSPGQPGDASRGVVPAAALAADVAGLGVSLLGRAIGLSPAPVVLPWMLSQLEHRLGGPDGAPLTRTAGQIGVTVVRAASQALAHGEVGLLTDAAYRLCLTTEARAWQAVWAEREHELTDTAAEVEPATPSPSPDVASAGPGRRLTRVATLSALSAASVGLALVCGPRAFGLLVSGTSTAGRVGKEAFAAQLGRSLARRGVVGLDPSALRQLDRIDVTILDADTLLTGRHRIDDVRPLSGDADPVELYMRAHELVDPRWPDVLRRREEWAVQRTGRSAREPAGGWRRGPLGTRRPTTLTLTHHGVPVGRVRIRPELDPLAVEVVEAARRAGEVILASGTAELRARLSLEGPQPARGRLADRVRELQREGRGVAVVSAGGDEALAAADCGIGVLGGGRVPWTADVLCGPGLAEVCLLLDAMPAARATSRKLDRVTQVGSAAGMVLALAGPARGAAHRAMAVGAGVALFSMATGTWSAMALTRRPEPLSHEDSTWHMLESGTALQRLGSGPDGLTTEEASRRLAERAGADAGGDEGPGWGRAALRELENPLTPALSVAAGTSAVTGAMVDAALIGMVLSVNALIGGAQRVKADRAMRRLVDSSRVVVRVRRPGRVVQASAEELVPGDVIELQAGDAVPADCRLLESAGLEVDESSLTGESLLVGKSSRPSGARAVADRHSMVHEGTSIAAGRASAVVVATGSETELGRTARVVERSSRSGGVEARLQELSRTTVPICVGAGGAVVAAGMLWRRPFLQSLSTGISLGVAAVPEGLPFVATVAQLRAAARLSHRNALVRQPGTIEALGRVNVLCFDKTGTLTEGRIRLRAVSDGRSEEDAESLSARLRPILAAALRATPQPTSDAPLPHPTDQAVVEGAARCGISFVDGASWRAVDELPFEPARGYHAVLGQGLEGFRIVVKGAPEVVAPRCASWEYDGHLAAYDETAQRDLAQAVERLARRGYRVLAVAERPVEEHARLEEHRLVGMTLLGLVALADPVRSSAAEAVDTLVQAGVDVAMVTGDHPSTAEAIAAELGLLDGRGVMTGPEMDALDDQALSAAVPRTVVFARTTPAHKVRIVELLRRSGRVVAVTGDGANDAPAIKAADVGVALGKHGTNAAKEAADVVITDDRIETITDAIVEGRALWVSVRDALAVMLGGNFAEIAFTLATGLLTPGGSALNARQLLLVNLLTDVLPAMAIAAQRPARFSPQSLLGEGPDSSLGAALTREIGIRATASTGAATGAWLLGRMTGTRGHAGTMALVGLVSAQLGQTLLVGRHSPLVLSAGLASIAALAVAVQTPGLSRFFGCRPLGPLGWGLAVGAAVGATIGAGVAARVLRPGALTPDRPAS